MQNFSEIINQYVDHPESRFLTKSFHTCKFFNIKPSYTQTYIHIIVCTISTNIYSKKTCLNLSDVTVNSIIQSQNIYSAMLLQNEFPSFFMRQLIQLLFVYNSNKIELQRWYCKHENQLYFTKTIKCGLSLVRKKFCQYEIKSTRHLRVPNNYGWHKNMISQQVSLSRRGN